MRIAFVSRGVDRSAAASGGLGRKSARAVTLTRLKALHLLAECTGDDLWSVSHCRLRGVPDHWISELTDCFESGFDSDRNTLRRTMGLASLGGATLDNEENYLIKKLFTALGALQIENQARI